MEQLMNFVVGFFNGAMMIEFFENGYRTYFYDADVEDYVPCSDTHLGYMDWNFANRLGMLGFTKI